MCTIKTGCYIEAWLAINCSFEGGGEGSGPKLILFVSWASANFCDDPLCPLHISRTDAPIVPRCCRLGQCEWSPDTESAVGASSGGHREVIGPIGSRTCTTQLRVVINKTLSPYQPGSRTILYDSLVPTDTLRAIRPM